MAFLDYLAGAFHSRLVSLVSLDSPFSLVSLTGSFAIMAWMFFRRRTAGRGSSRWRVFLRSAFPARILAHPSTRLDLWMFLANAVLLGGAYGLMVIASPFWKDLALAGMNSVFGARAPLALPDLAILAIVTPVDILAIEFGYWLSHFMMHRIPFLWEFHKVHHSAEVMTPLTEWRQHPVEMVLFPNLIGLCTGMTYGVLVYLLGEAAQPLSLWHVNVLFIVFFLTISHLRHSHVWLPLTGVLGCLIHSPAHHQIHHSTKPVHFDKNLGFSLSVWDWMFGTLFLPAKREALTFGLGADGAEHDRIDRSFGLPFLRAWAVLRGR